ncbi:hypothetical protein WJX72_004200 [[Myrmecia] bisecta]|uniref:Uncharacterized protein n=1 Tax=[Myrmecia] bisecta TaxID=41462 RepID=A0AAW1QF46_9CHLO
MDKRRTPKTKSAAARRARAQSQMQGMDAQQRYEAGLEAVAYDDFDNARQHLRQATELAPQNLEYLGAYGALLAEAGPREEAVVVLQREVALSPDKGFEKFMYLGQLLEGEAAINNLRRGVQVLQAEVQALAEAARPEADVAKQQLAGALCSLVEAQMNSAADVAGVAPECEELLQRAREADASSPEPQQVLASLRVEQGRPEEALDLLKQSMALWFPRMQAIMKALDSDSDEEPAQRDGSADGAAGEAGAAAELGSEAAARESDGEEAMEGGEDGDGDGDDDGDAHEALPSFEFRFETAKLLVELDESTDDAIQILESLLAENDSAPILESLLAENDSAPDVWYLMGMCLHAGGEPEEALEALEEGLRLLRSPNAPAADASAEAFEELKAVIQAYIASHNPDAVAKEAEP